MMATTKEASEGLQRNATVRNASRWGDSKFSDIQERDLEDYNSATTVSPTFIHAHVPYTEDIIYSHHDTKDVRYMSGKERRGVDHSGSGGAFEGRHRW